MSPRAIRFAGRASRRRGPAILKISPAVLVVDGETAILRVRRRIFTPNRSLWAHWKQKHRDRRGWDASIKSALIAWLDETARTRAARAGLVGELVRGELPPAPAGRYTVLIERVVPQARDLIQDDDNLTFSVKPILDSLVSCGLIYSDRREHLERPLPVQTIGTEYEAVIRVTPFWRLQEAA